MIKKYTILLLTFLFATNLLCQGKSVKSFPLSSVHLTSGPFYETQLTDMRYILDLFPVYAHNDNYIRQVPYYTLHDIRYVVYFHAKKYKPEKRYKTI